jgi:hypothetical protein
MKNSFGYFWKAEYEVTTQLQQQREDRGPLQAHLITIMYK